MPPRREHERRRAGPAIEIFVGAAHGHVRPGRVQPHLHHARAVAEIPDHERARRMRPFRDLDQIALSTRPVIHLIDQHDGDILVDQLEQIRAFPPLEPRRHVRPRR